MKPDELEHLLGGYATGTLTPEEQKALFEAALRDQKLFDALAREQALKEALDDPAVRRELIADLDATPPSWRERLFAWMNPRYPIAAGALAVAAMVTVVAIVKYSGPGEPAPVQIAENRSKAAPAVPVEPASPPPAREQSSARRSLADPEPKVRAALPPSVESVRKTESEQKEEAPPERGGVVGGVIGGVVAQGPAAAVPPSAPRPQPAAEEAPAPAVAEQRAMKTAAAVPDSAEGSDARARDLFYSRFTSGGAAPSGLTSRSMRDESRSAAAPAGPPPRRVSALGLRYSLVRSGSSARIAVESNGDAVVYAFRRIAADEWTPIAPGGLSLRAHAPATIPEFEAGPQVLLILSRAPLPDLAQTGPALTSAIEKRRAASDPAGLITERTGSSTYVIAPLPAGADVVAVMVETK